MTATASAPEVLRSTPLPLPPEEQARADFHALLAQLLLRPPDGALLAALASADALHAQQDGHALDGAWERLISAAAVMEADAVREEFESLFISTGMPPVNPYGSYYLAGFMMEKPLAALRDDLARLGMARRRGVGEPEDHLGALCEAMRALIAGVPGAPGIARRPLAEQRAFFMKHIAPWYGRALDDIAAAQGANFYRIVADLGRAFLDIEFQAFEMEASSNPASALLSQEGMQQ